MKHSLLGKILGEGVREGGEDPEREDHVHSRIKLSQDAKGNEKIGKL
jgi:hypothetical protein